MMIVKGGIKMECSECTEHRGSNIGVVDGLVSIVFQIGDVESNGGVVS
jgi:hypothetical protein